MIFRRNPYVEPGDIFASLLVFLIFAGIFAVIFFYIGYIGLIIFLSIGVAIGLGYALYIYIKNFVVATKSLSSVSSTNLFKTMVLRWFTLFKVASRDAFFDNIAVARSALTKSHAYRLLSFRKWMWIIVAPTTLLFGSVLIVAIIALQALLFLMAVFIVIGIIAILCVLMFFADIVYSIIATCKNFSPAFAGKDNIFKRFEFNMSSSFKVIPTSVKNYFVTFASYMKGIWDENCALGKSNTRMGSGYKLLSFRRYFLFLSIATLILSAIIFNLLISLVLCVAFVLIFASIILWILIATLIRLIIR